MATLLMVGTVLVRIISSSWFIISLSLSVCDCNGYNNVCDINNGTCNCLDAGVSGDHCTICNTLSAYQGNASNFCYCELI